MQHETKRNKLDRVAGIASPERLVAYSVYRKTWVQAKSFN